MNGKISNFAQICSIRHYKMTSGKEEGLNVIECNNGRICFLLNVSKALDIMQLYHEGKNMSFISKNGFTKREIPFLNRFEGGMLYTCGLDSVGSREGFELHGSFHNIPSEIVRAECDENGIIVEAIIRDTSLFEKNLVVKRRIFTAIESDSLEVCDSLINNGYSEENYCLLYHINIGYPMLDDGSIIVADIDECIPRTNWANENEKAKFEITDSIPNNEETCYFLTMKKPEISLINNNIKKIFTISYSKDTLPYFLEWKSMVSGDYALGLEPCTTNLDDKFEYKVIKPNETIDFKIKITISDINIKP